MLGEPDRRSAGHHQFSVGDEVSKTNGDYRFDGIVVAAFRKRSGLPRYVVEDDRGILHIFGPANLERRIP